MATPDTEKKGGLGDFIGQILGGTQQPLGSGLLGDVLGGIGKGVQGAKEADTTSSAVGSLLGIPAAIVSPLLSAVGNSIRPDGKISVTQLLDLGGVRTARMKAQDQQARANEMSLKAQELENKLGVAKAAQGAVQSGSPEIQSMMADIIGGPSVSPIEGPTLEADQARHATLAGLGLAPEQIQARIAENASQDTRQIEALSRITGVPPDLAATTLGALPPKGRGELLGRELSARTKAERQALRDALKPKGGNAEKNRERLIYDMTKRFLPPRTTKEQVTTVDALGRPKTTTVTRDRPLTEADVEQASQMAEKAVDRILKVQNHEIPGKEGIKGRDIVRGNQTKKAVKAYVEGGLGVEDAILAAMSEKDTPRVAMALPKKGNSTRVPVVSSDLADRMADFARLRPVVGVFQQTAPDDAALRNFAIQLLTDAGYDETEIPSLLTALGAELKRRGS